MRIKELIPIHERDGLKCQFCGTTKSVKYILSDGRTCCNKCALLYSSSGRERNPLMNEFCKCNFCTSYDIYEGCEWGCSDGYDSFHPNTDRIIEKAKEKGISVSDVLALIELENRE